MGKIMEHIRFQDYFKFEKGGLKVIGVKGLMYPVSFLSLLYQISSELSTKEKVDEIIYLAGKRQSNNAMEYTKNKIGFKNKTPAQICEFSLSQSEIGGMGTLRLLRVDNEAKKTWFVLETEYFEDVLNAIYSTDTGLTHTAVVQYLKGAIAAVTSFAYETPMKVDVTFNEKEKKYYYTSYPLENGLEISHLNKEELEKIKKVLSAYQWKHILV